jgi:hypothetical protein
LVFEIAVWPIRMGSALLQGSRYGWPSDVHPLCRGLYDCLAQPIVMNRALDPRKASMSSDIGLRAIGL